MLELHADELSFLDHEPLGRVILDDVDCLFLRVLELPRRRLEIRTRATRDDCRLDAAKPPRGAAAIHGRVADADDEHARRDLVDVPEVNGAEPLDADVDMTLCAVVPAAGDIELLSFRRAAADVHRVEAVVDEPLQALDLRVVMDLGAHVDDVVRLIIEDLLGQAERGDVEAHQPAGARVLLVDHDLVAHGEEVIRDGERARSGADERDALAVPNGGRFGEVLGDVVT